MAPAFFITWLRLQLRSSVFYNMARIQLRSGCALLIHFNNFGIPSRPVTSLGHQWGEVFSDRGNFFKLSPIALKYV